MSDWLSLVGFLSQAILLQMQSSWELLGQLMPLLLILEAPLTLLVLLGILRWSAKRQRQAHQQPQSAQLTSTPKVSCLVTCYSEGEAVLSTVRTMLEQDYPGQLELLIMVDGATQNQDTYQAAMRGISLARAYPRRSLKVLPKWIRGGRVSSLNAALSNAEGELVFALDGDTSFDRDMISQMVKQFVDPNVIAAGGALRVRNWQTNVVTRMQALEYLISMQGAKTGLSSWGIINNISGAFGAFRRRVVQQAGGWDTHTAEDLDLTLRLQQYRGRHPKQRMPFNPHAVGHTDVPDRVRDLVKQRLRWDGDLMFIYLRKHRRSLTPKLLGWRQFIFTLVYGVFQGITLPLLVSGYLIAMAITFPWSVFCAVLIVFYGVYLLMTLLLYVAYLTLISERFAQDCRLAIWLPLFPLYAMFVRLVSATAQINELLRRSHEETSMAPWWVLKRGQRF